MNKLNAVSQLPSRLPSAVVQMKQLEQSIGSLDQALAVALNRIENQQDAMAQDLLPLVELRDQVTTVLTSSFQQLRNTTDAAREVEKAMSGSLRGLQEAARLLEFASQKAVRARLSVWKYVVASALLSAVVTTACVRWYAPPVAPVDAQVVSEQVVQRLLEKAQRGR